MIDRRGGAFVAEPKHFTGVESNQSRQLFDILRLRESSCGEVGGIAPNKAQMCRNAVSQEARGLALFLGQRLTPLLLFLGLAN